MIKEYVFHEVLGGFNPDIVLANKPTALYQGLNLDLEKEPGVIRKRNGYQLFGVQLVDTKPLLGLYDFVQSSGTRIILAVSNVSAGTSSTLSYWTGSAWANGATSLTASKYGRFENMVGYCFFTNSEEIKTSSDGQTWSTTNLLNTVNITAVSYSDPTVTLTVPAGHEVVVGDVITIAGLAPAGYNGAKTVTAITDTTIVFSEASLGAVTDQVGTLTVQFALAANDVLQYGNYLWLIGLKGFRSDVMWSKIATKSGSSYVLTWTRVNNTTIRNGDGEDLVGGITYRGALYFFKNNSISRTITPIESNGVKTLTENIGAPSKLSIAVVGDQLCFFCNGEKNAKKGIYSYDSLSDAEPKIISEPMQPYIDGMTAGVVPVAFSLNDLLCMHIGAVTNTAHGLSLSNCVLVFNTKTNRWLGAWEFKSPVKVAAQVTVSNVTKPYFGDDDGKIWKTDTGNVDAYESAEVPGTKIPWKAISHSIDIAAGQKIRSNVRQRKVKGIWVYGEMLEGVQFRYRFDKLIASKDGYNDTIEGMSMPVFQADMREQDAYLFQFEFSGVETFPQVRKLAINYE